MNVHREAFTLRVVTPDVYTFGGHTLTYRRGRVLVSDGEGIRAIAGDLADAIAMVQHRNRIKGDRFYMKLACDKQDVRRVALATWWYGKTSRTFPSGKRLHLGAPTTRASAVIAHKPIAHDPNRAIHAALVESTGGLVTGSVAEQILEALGSVCNPTLASTDLSWFADIVAEAARITKDEV